MEGQPDYQGPGEWHTQAEALNSDPSSQVPLDQPELTEEEVEVATAIVNSLLAEASEPGLALQVANWAGDRAIVVGLAREEEGTEYVLPLAVLLTESVMRHVTVLGTEEEANEE